MPFIEIKFSFAKFKHVLNTYSVSEYLKKTKKKENYLVIGAGNKEIKGWIHSDIQGISPLHLDVKKNWNINELLDGIYGEMIWGDFNRTELVKVLTNAYHSLKNGGRIRICTLDFIEISRIYLGLSENVKPEDLLKRNRGAGYLGQKNIDILFHAACGHYGMSNKNPRGSFLHDFEVFQGILTEIGFKEIEICNTGESKSDRFRNLESRNSEIEKHIQLCIEAVK